MGVMAGGTVHYCTVVEQNGCAPLLTTSGARLDVVGATDETGPSFGWIEPSQVVSPSDTDVADKPQWSQAAYTICRFR